MQLDSFKYAPAGNEGATTSKSGHIPFRDMASASNIRGVPTSTVEYGDLGVVEVVNAEQQSVWSEAAARAARKNRQRGKSLMFCNLVPVPDPSLWQSTPEAPFREVQSEPGRAALACCNLHSSMVEGQDERGRAAYACSVGDTAIWRRQPQQLQSTLAFMLGKDEGRLYRVPTAEFEVVQKCQLWLRANNPHVRSLMTNLERFGELYKRMQTLIPQCRKDVQVRIQRTRHVCATMSEALELEDTIGDEEAVLVVVDPQELPRTWASVDILREQIGEGTYRVTPAGEAPDQRSTMDEQWGPQISAVAADLQEAARVTLGDVHLDAKLYPQWHPYGSGSLRAADDKVKMQAYLQQRLMSLQHDFRRSPVWSFQSLDRLIKNDMYFRHQKRK